MNIFEEMDIYIQAILIQKVNEGLDVFSALREATHEAELRYGKKSVEIYDEYLQKQQK